METEDEQKRDSENTLSQEDYLGIAQLLEACWNVVSMFIEVGKE